MPKQNNKCTRLPDSYLIFPKTPLPRAKQYVTSKRCECGCYVQLEDNFKGEIVCPVCGLVKDKFCELSENNLIYGSWSKSDLYTGNCYTPSEKEFMKRKKIKTRTYTGNTELNNMDYKYLIDVFKVELCLSSVDVNNIWIIIKQCKGLHNIHSKLSYEKVLLGICRFILINKGITGYLINLNNTLYRDYKLSAKEYNVIEKNIKKYRALSICNT